MLPTDAAANATVSLPLPLSHCLLPFPLFPGQIGAGESDGKWERGREKPVKSNGTKNYRTPLNYLLGFTLIDTGIL